MRATVMFGAGDVRIENVPDARLIEPTDALVTVTRACICGSDLWPYKTMEHSETVRVTGHEAGGAVGRVGVPQDETMPASQPSFYNNVTVSGGPAPVRAYIEELLPDILEGRIEPGRVLDRVIGLDEAPGGYRAMNDREAIKVMIEF